jgi:putative transposase
MVPELFYTAVVFAPKYRRQIIYGRLRQDVGKILRMLCQRKGIEIIEAECCKDHVHMLIKIPPKYRVADIIGYLKGKSSLIIFERHANLKYKYENRHFGVQGILCRYGGKKREKNRRIHKTAIAGRLGSQSNFNESRFRVNR